jgi:endo-1,3-1,4-beta-glycanase ExoK
MKSSGLVMLLALGAAATDISLSGAEIYSNETVLYGRWEIRMKAAAAPATVSSFFTYYPNSSDGSPYPWKEIDIEVLGNKPDGFQSNIITGCSSDKTTSESFHDLSSDLSTGFHTYVLDWTPDSVVWRLDGTVLRKDTGGQVDTLRDTAQAYHMNLWASTASGWVGTLDTAQLPVVQVVNWVAYSSYTPGAGTDGGDFTSSWVDDFTTLNTSRWSRASWTFADNYATFTPSNIEVKSGYLVMLLSTEGTTGVFPEIPEDSLGSTRSTSAVAGRASSSGTLQVRGAGEGAIEVVSQGGAEVRDLRGRVLARVAGSESTTVSGLPRGVALVNASTESRAVLVR